MRIERLAAWLGASKPPPGVLVSIGDDAAVLLPGREALVFTVDAAVEGVHFRRDWLSFEDIGYRSLMAAASDLAAMGARPRGVLSSLILPHDVTDTDLESLARGQAAAAQALGTAVVGGNLARGTELSITTSVLGEAERPLARSGARIGDVVALGGPIGLARAGLLALSRGQAESPLVSTAVAAWRRPRARIEQGLAAGKVAHAAIDLSDGLQIDTHRLARDSRVRVVLVAELLLNAGGGALMEAAETLGEDALELARVGGEDYAVFAAFAEGEVPESFIPVGICTEGSGVAIELDDGTMIEAPAEGFDHFAS